MPMTRIIAGSNRLLGVHKDPNKVYFQLNL